MPLGNELVVCELEMLTRIDDENVLHGKESLVGYTQLGTMDSAVLDEWQHLAGTMRETTHVTHETHVVVETTHITYLYTIRVVFTFICPNTWRGWQGVSWDHHTGCLFAASASWLSFSLPASSSWHSKGDGFAVVKPTSLTLVSHQPLQICLKGSSF